MIKQVRKLPRVVKVFVAVPPPLYEPAPYSMNGTVMNDIFPILIRDLANVTETEVVDVYSAFSSAAQMCDNCHPNSEGTKVIANAMYEKIVEVPVFEIERASQAIIPNITTNNDTDSYEQPQQRGFFIRRVT
jgi:lysophospholipase L1-like esterase